MDLSKYYGQNPNGNWLIKALHTSDILNDVSANSSSGTVNTAAIELCTRKTVSTLAVKDLLSEKDDFQVYPNPSNGKFSILMKNNAQATLQVFDLSGRLVHTQRNVKNDTKIDLSGFTKGNFILTLEKDDKKVAKKIIIR